MYLKLAILILLTVAIYYVGVSQCHQKNLSQKLKEVSYVKSKEIEILSAPNADKSDLLNLMFYNKL